MRIGVLALQGAFIEHVHMLERLGVEAVEIRLPAQLDGIHGLVMPGGESTTFGKLATTYGLVKPLIALGKSLPMWGTCAGLASWQHVTDSTTRTGRNRRTGKLGPARV